MTKTLSRERQFPYTHIDCFNEKQHGGIYRRVCPSRNFGKGFLSGAVIVFATGEVTDLITNGRESDPFSELSHCAYVHTDACTCTCTDHERDIDRKQVPKSLAPQWNSIKLAAEAFEFLSRIGRFHELLGRQSVAGNSWKTLVRSFV